MVTSTATPAENRFTSTRKFWPTFSLSSFIKAPKTNEGKSNRRRDDDFRSRRRLITVLRGHPLIYSTLGYSNQNGERSLIEIFDRGDFGPGGAKSCQSTGKRGVRHHGQELQRS